MKLNETTDCGPVWLPVRSSWGLALLLLAGLPACADKVSHLSNPCPCATGNVCCSSGVCAKDEASCGQATLALSQEAAGTWTGYFENFALASGSDALRITLGVSGGNPTGQVVLGSGLPPPPPTDTKTPWPPGAAADSGAGPVQAFQAYMEGNVYEARDITWESRRLRFRVALGDPWQRLCDLYAPITVAGQTFICPNGGWSYDSRTGCAFGQDRTPIDCDLLGPCGNHGPCDCGETSCVATAGDMTVDVALRGDVGDGSATGLGNATINIRLMRQ